MAIQCTVCGKFTSYLNPDKEPWVIVHTPDSDLTEEKIEIICVSCQPPKEGEEK